MPLVAVKFLSLSTCLQNNELLATAETASTTAVATNAQFSK